MPGELTLRFLKKSNRNLRFQIRIKYLKNESNQINLLKNSFSNLDLKLRSETTNPAGEAEHPPSLKSPYKAKPTVFPVHTRRGVSLGAGGVDKARSTGFGCN